MKIVSISKQELINEVISGSKDEYYMVNRMYKTNPKNKDKKDVHLKIKPIRSMTLGQLTGFEENSNIAIIHIED